MAGACAEAANHWQLPTRLPSSQWSAAHRFGNQAPRLGVSDGMHNAQPPWWQTATIYQVYPRSFQDADGDGVGDLRGVTARLPYLAELAVDAIWLSPIFRSPMKDFGYDISGYMDIDPVFGTMADFDALLAAAHKRGLKLLLDFVPNHTSDQHPWFVESRSSQQNAKRDWYLWRNPAPDGGPPTTGYRNSAAAPGNSMPLPGSIIITLSLPSSPI
jgi:glycosidase